LRAAVVELEPLARQPECLPTDNLLRNVEKIGEFVSQAKDQVGTLPELHNNMSSHPGVNFGSYG
jgi:hypothetical protein